jgi:hypothetical protein
LVLDWGACWRGLDGDFVSDIKAWGWEWIKKAHVGQLEFKTGMTGEESLFELMATVANKPDEKVPHGKFEDNVKRVDGSRLVLRLRDDDPQTFIPVSEVKGPAVMADWKFRGARKIMGEAGLAHSGIGMFSTHHIAPVSAFIPCFPVIESKLKFLEDIPVAMELIPTSAKKLKAKGETKKEIIALAGDDLQWHVKLRGVVQEPGYNYTLIDAGMPLFVEKRGYLNLTPGDSVEAEGALFAYPDP